MPYWQLYYHIVWATHNREQLITANLEPALHKYLRGKGLALGGVVHAVGGIEDHVHIAVSVPPRLAIATFVGQLKGASSHWVNHLSGYPDRFAWQNGYGVLSFGKSRKPFVVRYVQTQRQHHLTGNLVTAMEHIEVENVGPAP